MLNFFNKWSVLWDTNGDLPKLSKTIEAMRNSFNPQKSYVLSTDRIFTLQLLLIIAIFQAFKF